MSNFQYPKITGRTSEEKIGQIVSFLRQLVDQLNYEGTNQPSNVSAMEQEKMLAAIREQLDIK